MSEYQEKKPTSKRIEGEVSKDKWRPFYEARLNVEIFVELYDSTLSSPVSSYFLQRNITFCFINVAVIVYYCHRYGYPTTL